MRRGHFFYIYFIHCTMTLVQMGQGVFQSPKTVVSSRQTKGMLHW